MRTFSIKEGKEFGTNPEFKKSDLKPGYIVKIKDKLYSYITYDYYLHEKLDKWRTPEEKLFPEEYTHRSINKLKEGLFVRSSWSDYYGEQFHYWMVSDYDNNLRYIGEELKGTKYARKLDITEIYPYNEMLVPYDGYYDNIIRKITPIVINQ